MHAGELKGWDYVGPIAADGSSRRFTRLSKGSHSAVLMETDGRTPGHDLQDFIRIGSWINKIGLKAPAVYEQYDNALLVEDFGDISFKKAIGIHAGEQDLYDLALAVLDVFSSNACPLSLPEFAAGPVKKGHRRLIDWYYPVVKREAPGPETEASYMAAWQKVESCLDDIPHGFLHIDYHCENLMWLPEETGLKCCGILDFQGAMTGPRPYDFVNLLEDMRRDVAPPVKAAFLARQDQNFRDHYIVLAAQFHCRLLGQCIRWAVRDAKPQYLAYIPRLQRYLEAELEAPVLNAVKQWFLEENLDLSAGVTLNDVTMRYINSDSAY